jgi:type VI secretion system protein ImpL
MTRDFFVRMARNRWIRTGMGVAVLAIIIWFFGPLIAIGSSHILQSEAVRLIVIGVLILGWIIENLIHTIRAGHKDKELAEGVAQADPSAEATAEEIATLSDRLKEAMAALKKAKIGGRGKHLYQLPWYMFIGPPGAGKTTALVNAGLNFPLADTHGPHAIRGVGGTRNCDWWFTDQAVLIDTAGRYTTQDSDNKVDANAWLGFLRLLKRTRRRQPLNGVLVAIGLSDLATLSEAERGEHARAIRKRIRELHDELGVRIPVYVLFTKADMVAGFVEFFDNLGKEEREQVWGATFALDDGKDEAGAIAAFAPEFDLLLGRLNDRVLERLNQETDLQRRRLIWGFPQQIASLRGIANDFLTEIFRPSRLEARPLLRGVYLTSGTQDGTPIDRLLGAMAGQFGLQRQAVTAFTGAGRSYFLTRLVRDVVFGEAGLVSKDPRVERRQRLVAIAAWSVAALVLIVVTGLWTISWLGNRDIIETAHAAATKYQTQYAELMKRGPQDTELPPILPPLATLRTIPTGYEQRTKETPWRLTYGLYQGEKISSASVDAYVRALNGLMLPRLLSRLEQQIQDHMDKADQLYSLLKVYLILGRQGPLDRDLVGQWFAADLISSYPGDDDQATREALMAHLQALLEYPLANVALNGPLVAQARAVLNRQPQADYIYNRMLRSAVVQGLPEWTVADNAGPGAPRVFVLRDGKPITTGMPGIFTWEGYHNVFLPLLPRVTKDAAEDAWVLGKQATSVVASVTEMNRLRRDILSEYLDDYTRHWDEFLDNIAVKPFTSVADGKDELFLLSAPDSPLRNLLQAIDGQTQLSRPAATEKAASQAEAKAGQVTKQVGGFANYLTRAGLTSEQNQMADILGSAFGSDASGKPVDPATRVDQHFAGLHAFVSGSKDQPAQLDAVMAKLLAVYQGMNQAASAPNQGQALLSQLSSGGGAAASQQLQDAGKGAPKAVAAMLSTVAQSNSQVTASGADDELGGAWRSKVLPLCQAAFNRYPFVAGSAQDVPVDDFVHLLGPGGLMDQFFDQYLKNFVDNTVTPWKWQAGGDVKLGLSNAALTEFQRAADIRDGLFPTGGQQIAVKFQLVPIDLAAGLSQVSVDIGGQRLTYAHGPVQPQAFQWPGPKGETLVRVTLTPADGGAATVIERDDPWSLLRLMDAGRVTSSGQPDKFQVAFSAPAGSANFSLTASSVRNPFTLSALRSFRCPPKL